jgi:hypothetical protein
VGALELGRGQRGPVRSFDPARTEGDPHRRQVDVVPPQREQLSSPRPGDRGQHYEDVEDRIAGGDVGEQPLHLRGCRGRISRGGTTRRCARPAGLSRSKCQAPVPERHSGHGTHLTGRTSGGVDAVGAAAVVGEGAVFAGAVVLGSVAADQLLADRDLDGVGDDGDLDLATAKCVADSVVGAPNCRLGV